MSFLPPILMRPLYGLSVSRIRDADIVSPEFFCLLITFTVGLNFYYSGLSALWLACVACVTALCKRILANDYRLASMLLQNFHCLGFSPLCLATSWHRKTSRNTLRSQWASLRHGFAHDETTRTVSERRNPTFFSHFSTDDNNQTSQELSERTLFIPTGVNVTAKFFGKEREHGQKVVFKSMTRSSIYASLQVSHGVSVCAKTAVSGQLALGQAQDLCRGDSFQASGKRSNYQREGSDEEEDKDAPRKKRAKKESSPSRAKKLACPYYRNDPENHRKHRSCAGPGWTSIHRVKEHILRQHALPIHCPRCLCTFNTETECKLHLRQTVLCPLSDSTPPEGYNKRQETSLRIRRRGNAEREWVAIYKLLFPSMPEELIPSPYYDDDDTQLEKLQRRESNRFQRHMEHAVPRSVSRLLEQTRFELSTSLDVPMRTRLVEIVVRAVAEASQSYRQHEDTPTEAQASVVLNEPSSFTQHPQIPGAPDTMPYLPISTLVHEPLQPQASEQQHGGLEFGLDHSTGVHDGIEHRDNDSRPGNELLVDPLLLDMSLFDWNPDQDISFEGP